MDSNLYICGMAVLYLLSGTVIGMIVGGAIVYNLIKKDGSSDDDPTGQIKQQISDALSKLKKDIQSTI